MRTTTIAPTHSGRDEVNEIVEAMSAELDQLARVLTDMIHEQIAELDDDLACGRCRACARTSG